MLAAGSRNYSFSTVCPRVQGFSHKNQKSRFECTSGRLFRSRSHYSLSMMYGGMDTQLLCSSCPALLLHSVPDRLPSVPLGFIPLQQFIMAPKDEYKPKSNSKSEMNKPKGGKAKVRTHNGGITMFDWRCRWRHTDGFIAAALSQQLPSAI
jgi:hypothetical protein